MLPRISFQINAYIHIPYSGSDFRRSMGTRVLSNRGTERVPWECRGGGINSSREKTWQVLNRVWVGAVSVPTGKTASGRGKKGTEMRKQKEFSRNCRQLSLERMWVEEHLGLS